MQTPHRFLFGAFLSLLLLGGCKDLFPPDDDDDPKPIVTQLPGTAWRLVSYEKDNGEVVVVDDPAQPITLRFTDSSCGGDGPCNTYGAYCGLNTNGAGTIDIGSVISTERACSRLGLEQLYFTALDAALRYTSDASGLHLLMETGSTVAILNFAPLSPPTIKPYAIQYRKVEAASDVFSLHRILSDGSNESIVAEWMNFMSCAPQNGVSAYLGRKPNSSGGFSVMVSEPGGSGPRVVVSSSDIDFTNNSVVLSPDGNTIAAICYDPRTAGPLNYYHVYLYRRSDGMPIDTCLDAEPFTTPAFSPDGKHIAYYGQNNTVKVATIGSNSTEQVIAGNAMPSTLPCTGRLEWLPDNSGVLYVGANSSTSVYDHTDIWLAPAIAGSPVNLTNDPNIDCWPAVSPDGSQVAYVHRNDGGFYTIYRVKLQAANTPEAYGPMRLVNMVVHDLFPQWSPDGKQILYTAFTDVSASGGPGFSGTLEWMDVADRVPVHVAYGTERGFWEM